MVRVQPSVVCSDRLLPEILVIVIDTWAFIGPGIPGAIQPGPSSGWPGIVVGCAAWAVGEPPEATPRANATEATPARIRAAMIGKKRQRERRAVIRKHLSIPLRFGAVGWDAGGVVARDALGGYPTESLKKS